jgi:hypothetical protein
MISTVRGRRYRARGAGGGVRGPGVILNRIVSISLIEKVTCERRLWVRKLSVQKFAGSVCRAKALGQERPVN